MVKSIFLVILTQFNQRFLSSQGTIKWLWKACVTNEKNVSIQRRFQLLKLAISMVINMSTNDHNMKNISNTNFFSKITKCRSRNISTNCTTRPLNLDNQESAYMDSAFGPKNCRRVPKNFFENKNIRRWNLIIFFVK
jgi:hypothetical protein